MSTRGKWQGMMTIARFNWPFYVLAVIALIVSLVGLFLISALELRMACAVAAAGAAYFLFGSLGVSHVIYDRSDLYRWNWLDLAMIEILTMLLRIGGFGLILLAVLHIPIGKHLRWREDGALMTPVNAAVFHVHTFFICVVLVMMGLPCLFDPMAFLERSRGGAWLAWSFAAFWIIRLYCQWFVYRADLWRGKRMETMLHWWFTFVWMALAALFTVCGLVQARWLQ